MVRPSSKSTESVSSVTATAVILAKLIFAEAETVPFKSQNLHVLAQYMFNHSKLSAIEAEIIRKRYIRVKPELCAQIIAVYMHMTRLSAIV